MLKLLRRVKEIVRIRLGDKLALIGLLDKVFITLSLSEPDSIFLGLEIEMSSLHSIGG